MCFTGHSRRSVQQSLANHLMSHSSGAKTPSTPDGAKSHTGARSKSGESGGKKGGHEGDHKGGGHEQKSPHHGHHHHDKHHASGKGHHKGKRVSDTQSITTKTYSPFLNALFSKVGEWDAPKTDMAPETPRKTGEAKAHQRGSPICVP